MRTTEYEHYVLARRVIVTAVIHYEDDELFDWTAYIDSVPGINHGREYELVANTGAKILDEIAFILFPFLNKNKWRR